MANDQAWAIGSDIGSNAAQHGRARKEQLSDEQRKLHEDNLAKQAQSGAISPAQWAQATHDLYQHEPTESRWGRIGRGLERIVGQGKRADAQKAEADQKLGPSPKKDLASIEAGAKSQQTLEDEGQKRKLETYRGEQTAKAGIDREQAIQSVKDFAKTYKEATGEEPPQDMVQAFVLSALGGDKVLSSMTQAETLKARQEYQQATLRLRDSQLALNQAKFDASQDPTNPAFQLKLRQAESAAMKNKAYWIRAQAAVYGSVDGTALPGAMVDDEGRTIGSSFQSNVRPTGTQREKGTLATSAREQIADMRGILQKRGDLFGPGAGRAQKIAQWVGSPDPEAQRFTAAATTAADHLMGVFGGRSTWAGQRIESALGNLKTDPEATIAALEQFDKAAKTIEGIGSYKTVGGGDEASPTGGKKSPAPKKNASPGGGKKKHSLKKAMALPFNKGKSETEVKADLEKHGYEVTP